MTQGDLVALATAVVASVFALAFVFGAITQRTNFCTMGSVADVVTFGDWTRMRQWLLAIAVAILGTNLLAAIGVIDTADTFYTSPRFTQDETGGNAKTTTAAGAPPITDAWAPSSAAASRFSLRRCEKTTNAPPW